MMTVYIQRKKCVKKWNEKVPVSLLASAGYGAVPSLLLIQMLSTLCHALSSSVASLRTFASFVLTVSGDRGCSYNSIEDSTD